MAEDAMKGPAEVGVLLGSASDLDRVSPALETLQEFGIPYEVAVISAHRTPELVSRYASSARGRGIKVIIAAAGLSAALPGAVAALVDLPVIGLPVGAGALKGVDALLSMAQMPPGVPVATVGIDAAKNASLLAVRILGYTTNLYRKTDALPRVSSRRDPSEGDLVGQGLPQWRKFKITQSTR